MTPLTPLTPEILVPRLGDYLCELNLIQKEDLERALFFQQQLRKKGDERLLGQVLVELGLISQKDLDQAITEQILQLRNALQNANQQLEQRVKERTAELEIALKKLSELGEMKANFVANISHELRTPLTHLKGYLDLLETGSLGKMSDEITQAVTVMVQATARLEKLINDLILFSNSEKKQIPLEIQNFDLSDLIKTAILSHKHSALEKNIRIYEEVPAEKSNAIADKKKIEWVINELLENALKFSGMGSKIIMGVESQPPNWRFFIRDTGIGIPADRLSEIFEPFHQLDGSSTRMAGGTGLGLSLARQIIQAHNSDIEVTSEIHKGSEFSFLLKQGRST